MGDNIQGYAIWFVSTVKFTTKQLTIKAWAESPELLRSVYDFPPLEARGPGVSGESEAPRRGEGVAL